MKKSEEIILKGIGASSGVTIGIARICHEPTEASKKLEKGDVLVAPITDPHWTTYMLRAKGIITDSGGVLCHAAIIAREFGIPCVVGTKNATEVLRDGTKIRVDGLKGLIFKAEE